MAVWPATLPGPQRPGMDLSFGDNTKNRKTQAGRIELTRWGSGAPDQLQCTLRLLKDRVPEFEKFYDVALNYGMNWFSSYWLTRLGYTEHKARILGKPKSSGFDKYYRDYTLIILIKPAAECATDTLWPEGVI